MPRRPPIQKLLGVIADAPTGMPAERPPAVESSCRKEFAACLPGGARRR